MNRYRKFRTRTLIFGFSVVTILGVVGENAIAAGLPKDPCALLKPAEIQSALDPGGNVGSGVASADAQHIGINCSYSWGPRTKEWGESALTVTVIDATKGWPGTSPDLIEQGVLLKAKVAGSNGSVISGVGDAAVFTFEARSSNGTAEAYFKAKALHLSVTLHRGDALQIKDKVIALLKEAAARL